MKCTVIGPWGGYCKKNEACSGYFLSHKGDNLLIDCGSGVVSVMQNVVDLNAVNNIILTHYHYDHYSDAGVYIHSRLINTQVGASHRVLQFYGLHDNRVFPKLTWIPYSVATAIDEDSMIDVGPFRCTFLTTKHPEPCLAVKVTCGRRTLVYTSDTAWFEELARFARGADLLISECSLYAEHDGAKSGHMNSGDVAHLASFARPRRLLLSHLPLYGDTSLLLEDVKAKWDGKVELASHLMEIDLTEEDV